LSGQAAVQDSTKLALWDQVLSILGAKYVHASSLERLDKFKDLIINAARGGKEASGPVREVLALLGDRWSTLLLQLVHYGPLRFSALQKIIAVLQDGGISRRMLSLKLRALERDGLVLRTVSPSVPPRVTYSLTQMGEELWRIAASLVDWIDDHSSKIELARREFEQQEETGEDDQ
jgi:DNA-binding HxlR family transcriptional regulator